MASYKEMHSARPASQHRLSLSSHSGSLPRQPHARIHSYSGGGSLVPSHRVTRRKSVTSTTATSAAAVRAVVREGADMTGMPIPRRLKSTPARAAGSLPSPPPSLSGHRFTMAQSGRSEEESAIDDQIDDLEDGQNTGSKQARNRRASEGHQLMGGDKKASAGELKCDKCGKGYKHSSCLSKHRWEHTPAWSLTSKLLISKHQQVQLLEAASVLVAMNQDGTTPPDSARDFHSEQDSPSPAASGSSEHHDGASSVHTTPPPQADASGSYRGKRYSSGHGYSRSYTSGPSSSFYGSVSSAPGHHRQHSHDRRSIASFGRNHEDEGLVAAVEALSCSFGSNGTPRTSVPITVLQDAPPVPHIPAQYLNQNLSGSTLTNHPRQTESYTRHQVRDQDVRMEESEESVADDEDYDVRSRGRSDEEDDGVFGRMEE